MLFVYEIRLLRDLGRGKLAGIERLLLDRNKHLPAPILRRDRDLADHPLSFVMWSAQDPMFAGLKIDLDLSTLAAEVTLGFQAYQHRGTRSCGWCAYPD